MRQGLFLFLRSDRRRFARVKADKNDIVVPPWVEGEHTERADNTLFDQIAKHGAVVVDKSEDRRLPSKIVTQSDRATGLVTERDI